MKDIHEFENKTGHYYHNGKRVIQLFKELAEFLRTHEPAMRQWMMEYLDKNRKEIFVKWWSNHVSEWAKDVRNHNNITLHPNTQQEWDTIFGDDKATCFELAHRVGTEARSRYDFKNCDDLTILAIHEGKEHDGTCWGCDLCDEQTHAWETELVRRITNSCHPLLNPDKGKYLHYGWRHKEKVAMICDQEPPHRWGTVYSEERYHRGTMCYTLEEYEAFMRRTRRKKYGETGQTPKQAIEPILYEAVYHGGWGIRYFENYKTEYDAFICLWNTLDLMPLSFELDLRRLQEVEEMY